jgi:transcriptional regulator GlxA family with amidase domain
MVANRPPVVAEDMGYVSLTPRPARPHDGRVAAHRIVFVIFPDFQSLDLTGPFEVFTGANQRLGRAAYQLTTVATTAGPVRSNSGLTITASRSIRDVTPTELDTLIVAGGSGVMQAKDDPELIAWLSEVAKRCSRVVSVCTGTFLLAAAGVVVDERVTTHWAYADQLGREYPTLTVDPDPIFIRNGNVWTSAGVTSGIDAALAMVEEDHGSDVAQTVARWLVMFLRRPGGQSQFAASVWAEPAVPGPIRVAQDHIHNDPSADLSVPRLAERAAMSERHFLRIFSKQMGCTPGDYVERVRIDAARRLLEGSNDGVEVVARLAGFGTAETMRRVFVRRIGVSPSDYRRRFATATSDRTSA